MIRAAAIILLLAATPAAARYCYDLGHVGSCPALKPAAHATVTMTREPPCTGWIDDVTLECRHGIGGSGMGPRGYVGTNGGRGR